MPVYEEMKKPYVAVDFNERQANARNIPPGREYDGDLSLNRKGGEYEQPKFPDNTTYTHIGITPPRTRRFDKQRDKVATPLEDTGYIEPLQNPGYTHPEEDYTPIQGNGNYLSAIYQDLR